MCKEKDDYKKGYFKREYLLYLFLFGVLFLVPSLHIAEVAWSTGEFQWSNLLKGWIKTLPFAVLLLVNILFLQPILFERK